MPTAQAASPRLSGSHAAGWLTAGAVAAGGLNYVYALGLAFHLDAREYAVFAAGQALLVIKASLGGTGIPWALAQEIGLRGHDERHLADGVTFAFWWNVWSGLAVGALVTGVGAVFGSLTEALLLGGTSVVLTVGSTGKGFLQGFGRTEALAAMALSEALVKLVVGFALVVGLGMGAVGALLGPLAGACVPLVTVPLFARLVGRPCWRAPHAGMWRSAWGNSSLQSAFGVLAAGDGVLVASLPATAAGAGAYQVAATLGRVPLYVATAVATAIFPTLRRADGAERFAAGLGAYAVAAGFFALVLLTLPEEVESWLVDATYVGAARWLPLTAVLGFLIGLLAMLVARLQAGERVARSTVVLGVLTFGFLAAMWTGAAVAGLAGFVVAAVMAAAASVGVCALGLLRRGEALGLLARLPVRVVLASAGTAAALALAPHPVVWTAVVVGAAPFVALQAFPELAGRRRRLLPRILPRRRR